MSENQSEWIEDDAIDRLHPVVINDPERIRSLLDQLQREQVVLARGTNRKALTEQATIAEISPHELTLSTRNFRKDNRSQIFLSFELQGRPYFFSVPQLGWGEKESLRVSHPAVIYVAERRDRPRNQTAGRAARVALGPQASSELDLEIHDVSADGLSLQIPRDHAVRAGDRLRVRVDGQWSTPGEQAAEVRYVDHGAGPQQWKKIGLRIVPTDRDRAIQVERREAILSADTKIESASETDTPIQAEKVRYRNSNGEEISAFIDRWGDPSDATAIVIPPAWGLTKETLLPLAKTLVETFRNAKSPIAVLRFDGIRKRGESTNDPECELAGRENLNYTFSQGVSDINTTIDYLESDPATRPRRTLLVSFSMASIEARRALAASVDDRYCGWVSVVGSPDPQSLLRIISGGIDYFGGAERGIKFGQQDVQGLLLDIDRACKEAIEDGIAFVSDARRDFAKIRVPVTWIHGRYDAWNDLTRIRDVLSFGKTENRKLIEIPTGHQLKTSAEAIETFGLVAQEAVRIATGKKVSPVSPHPTALREGARFEKGRTPRKQVDLRGFWKDYLLGRDGHLGIELVTQTRAFRELMGEQIEKLALTHGARVVDLGCGTGSAPLALLEAQHVRKLHLKLVEVDYVSAALQRARNHISRISEEQNESFGYVTANLNLGSSVNSVPLAENCADCVLASLLLNYLENPDALMAEAARILMPGGRLVLSSLRPDADVSTICVSSVVELRTGLGRKVFGSVGERKMNESLRDFINDAGRLLDLEERGYFTFWEPAALEGMAERAGFHNIRTSPGYGKPHQAWVLSATLP